MLSRLCEHVVMLWQTRDEADFGEAGEGAEAAADGEGETGGTSAGSGLPWDGDDNRDYTYEELLGAHSPAGYAI